MDTLTKEVAVPLGVYMKSFPTVQRLHPFEQAMLELTWGTQPYEKVLGKVDSLRKSILQAKPLHPVTFNPSKCTSECFGAHACNCVKSLSQLTVGMSHLKHMHASVQSHVHVLRRYCLHAFVPDVCARMLAGNFSKADRMH